MEKKSNYELLRILSAVAVITLHISDRYLNAITSDIWLGAQYREHILVSSMMNALTRFAVPCFIMLSGTFTLDDRRNADYKYYYEKIFRKVGIHTIIFSAGYFLYRIFRKAAGVFLKGKSVYEMIDIVKEAAAGQPFHHMWYLYMMIGVYLLAPFVIRFKNSIGGGYNLSRMATIFLGASVAGMWTSTHTLQWDPTLSFGYLSYFIMGYVIRKEVEKKKSTVKGTIWILVGFGVLVFAGYLRYLQGINGSPNTDVTLPLLQPVAPIPVISSVFIFIGFSHLNLKIKLTKLSRLTFMVYLFHAGIWDILNGFVTKEMDSRIIIPVMTVLVFMLSLVAAAVYRRFWNWIESRFSLSEKISRKVFV